MYSPLAEVENSTHSTIDGDCSYHCVVSGMVQDGVQSYLIYIESLFRGSASTNSQSYRYHVELPAAFNKEANELKLKRCDAYLSFRGQKLECPTK